MNVDLILNVQTFSNIPYKKWELGMWVREVLSDGVERIGEGMGEA